MILARRSAAQMTLPATTYDLVLMLDPLFEPPLRAKIVDDVRTAIAAKGELLRHDDWGERALTYQIDHKATADYHLLQFHASTVELIEELNRTLRITDGVVRFRINKLKPGTPDAPDMRSSAAPTREEHVPTREEHVPAHEELAEPTVAEEHAVA
jgi:small subunit ribosomal protein S6